MSWEQEQIWRDNLKVGDEVCEYVGYSQLIARVERLTPTQIVLANGHRYSKKNGSRVGEDLTYMRNRIRELTPEIREEIEKKEFEQEILRHVDPVRNYRNLSHSALKRIVGIVREDITTKVAPDEE